MVFNRQLYKQKPKAWGPVSSVQASIFKNAESIGINPASIALAMPMWGPGGQLDYANPQNTFANSGVSYDQNSLVFNGSSSYLSQAVNSKIFETRPFTLFIKFTNIGVDVVSHWIFAKESFNLEDGFGFRRYGTGLYFTSGRSSSYFYRASEAISDGQTLSMCHRMVSQTDYDAFIDGKLVTGWTKSTGYNTNDPTTNTLQIGRSNGSYQGYHNGKIYYFYIFNTALTDGQITYLSDNPYFLLHRVPPVFYSVPGGGVLPIFNPLFLNAAQPTRVIQ